MTDTETAYLAGLFDGEGNVGVVKAKASKNARLYLRLVVRIFNTHRGCLVFAQQTYGAGWIGEDKRPNHPKWKTGYRWSITGKKAEAFLLSVRPYLLVKAAAVDELLSSPHSGRAT